MLELMWMLVCVHGQGGYWRKVVGSSSSWISLPKERILLKTVLESSGEPLEMQLLIALCKMSL